MSQPGFFNLTSTFRRDSDFPIPYFKTIKIKTNSENVPAKSRVLAKKKILMAWLVSHCETHSKREKYMEELSKHISVDIFGKCGKVSVCMFRRNRENRENRETCTGQLLERYKFYFAAENAICKDYFTGNF